MKLSEAESICSSLTLFNRLERKNTDEVGWIALRYSCTRKKAEKLISEARKMVASKEVTSNG